MLSTIIRHARTRRGLSYASVDQRAKLLPGTTQLIERHALNISDHEVLRGIAQAIEPNDEQARALYVQMLCAVNVLTPADVEAWVEAESRRAA